MIEAVKKQYRNNGVSLSPVGVFITDAAGRVRCCCRTSSAADQR